MSVSFADLEAAAAVGSAMDRLRLEICLWSFQKPSHAKWADSVELAIEHVMREMAAHRNYLHEDEDALTSTLVIALKCCGLSASHAMVNGNCDVTVRHAEFEWIGEAKIARGVTVVYGGYNQLTERYAPGVDSHARGGLLIYVFKDPAARFLAEWRAALGAQHKELKIEDGPIDLSFRSSGELASTGMMFSVVHFAFPLKHDPQDDRSLTPEALAAGRKARN